jgi:hypothetical protein
MNIYTDYSHFDKLKEDSEDYFEQTSIRLDVFVPIYLSFCTKNGLRSRSVLRDVSTLKSHKIKVTYQEGFFTQAYTNIRWKTYHEKVKSDQALKLQYIASGTDEDKEQDSVIKFIESECVKSDFDTDFILVSELLLKYDQFCIDQKYDDLHKGNIAGSPALEDFGAVLNQEFSVPYLEGVTRKNVPFASNRNLVPGLVKRPMIKNRQNRGIMFFLNIWANIKGAIFGTEGVISNLLTVIAFMLILFIIPLLLMLAVTWSLLQIEIINSDIFKEVHTISDVFFGSSYRGWYSDLDYSGVLLGMTILG